MSDNLIFLTTFSVIIDMWILCEADILYILKFYISFFMYCRLYIFYMILFRDFSNNLCHFLSFFDLINIAFSIWNLIQSTVLMIYLMSILTGIFWTRKSIITSLDNVNAKNNPLIYLTSGFLSCQIEDYRLSSIFILYKCILNKFIMPIIRMSYSSNLLIIQKFFDYYTMIYSVYILVLKWNLLFA